MTLPPDLEVRPARPGDEAGIAALVAACDESYRAWTPPGWEPPPPGAELDRWRGRIIDGSWWTRIGVEPGDRVVALVCFTQAVVQRTLPAPPGLPTKRTATITPTASRPMATSSATVLGSDQKFL